MRSEGRAGSFPWVVVVVLRLLLSNRLTEIWSITFIRFTSRIPSSE